MIVTGTAGNDILTGTDQNDVIRGLAGHDRLTSRGGNDDLFGGPGSDVLDGNRGADRMQGGGGNDRYFVDNLGDTVLETTAGRIGGVDEVFASVNFVLGDHLEHLTLFGTAQRGRGNDLANIIAGNSADNVLDGMRGDDVIFGGLGNDRLDGGLGNDRLDGGLGNDTYYADSRRDVIVERAGGGIDTLFTSDSRRLDAHVENLTMFGRALNAVGNELDNEIIGNSAANVILGEAGNDTINGGDGNDILRGGAGNDRISGGLIEYPVFPEGSDPAYKDDGVDVLDGGSGIDTAVFSSILVIESPHASANLSIDWRIDLRNGTALSLTEGHADDVLVSIENVDMGHGNDVVYGDAKANRISVGEGRNSVFAGDGDDIILGGYGISEALFNSTGGPSNNLLEVLRGGNGNDWISSGSSIRYEFDFHLIETIRTRDILIGGNGDDRLVGGDGLITMVGGAGADTFEFFDTTFNSGYFPGPNSGNTSHITDFNPRAGDTIIINREFHTSTPASRFVGEATDLDAGELGYERVVRGDNTHTILRHAFNPNFGDPELIYTAIILDNYAGPLTAEDFLFI